MAPRQAKTYTETFKAQIVAAAMTGTPLRTLATKHKLPISTVRGWTRKAGAGSVLTRSDPKRAEEVEDALLGYVIAALRAVTAIAESVADREYVQGQSARDLAVFSGVTVDKIAALFAAYSRSRDIGAVNAETLAALEPGRSRPAGEPGPVAPNPPSQATG